MGKFAASIAEWTTKVKQYPALVFRESLIELVYILDQTVPIDSGFLRASLTGSTSGVPLADLARPPGGVFTSDLSEITMMITHLKSGEQLFLGYRANYWAFVHYGTGDTLGRPWILLAAQRWPGIVARKSQEVKQRLSL